MAPPQTGQQAPVGMIPKQFSGSLLGHLTDEHFVSVSINPTALQVPK
jgi:hypothetical protein